jgi:erythromycin esterase-like protein
MFDTLNHLMHWRGWSARAVVWAHNSHVGNAAATDMGRSRDEINIGQLCREKFGDGAALIGFGTDRGTVAAADNWGGPMKIKTIRPAHPESYEYLCRNAGIQRFLLDLRKGQRDELRSALMTARLQRAIGVIYRPETELASHYFDAHLPEQFDGYVWFEETTAIKPLPTEPQEGLPETYPFGL